MWRSLTAMVMACIQCRKLMCLLKLSSTEILVGFERIFTLVDEDVGSFELCVEIFTDFSLLPNSFEFSLNLTTKSDTAGYPLLLFNSVMKISNCKKKFLMQVLMITLRLMSPTTLLCCSPLTGLLTDSVSMSQLVMMVSLKTRRDSISASL